MRTGHPPHLRQLLPPERVTQVVTFRPETCAHCQTTLPKDAGLNDPPPTRHQVVDLPPIIASVTEYQGHFRTCPCCGVVAHATIPATLKAHSVGPGLTGVFGFMSGELGMSKRNIEHFSQRIFAAPVSLGTIAHLEQELAEALARPHAEATQAVHAAPIKNVDETGWYQQGKKRWLWSAVTRLACVFIIHPLRNVDGLRQLAGPSLTGILCSDRWCVYDEWPDPFAHSCVGLTCNGIGRNWPNGVGPRNVLPTVA